MTFRDKVKRVFRRPSNNKYSPNNGNSNNTNSNGIKIEYYRRGEIPPSKFRGPFDRAHQKRLAAWTFEGAMAERCRSMDLTLSPCTTLPEGMRCTLENNDDDDVAPEDVNEGTVQGEQPSVGMLAIFHYCYKVVLVSDHKPCLGPSAPVDITRHESIPPSSPSSSSSSSSDRQANSGSQSSTAVDPDSLSSSLSTLLDVNYDLRGDSVAQTKESIRYTSPIMRVMSPQCMSPKGTCMPFEPEDLTRALNAVRICV